MRITATVLLLLLLLPVDGTAAPGPPDRYGRLDAAVLPAVALGRHGRRFRYRYRYRLANRRRLRIGRVHLFPSLGACGANGTTFTVNNRTGESDNTRVHVLVIVSRIFIDTVGRAKRITYISRRLGRTIVQLFDGVIEPKTEVYTSPPVYERSATIIAEFYPSTIDDQFRDVYRFEYTSVRIPPIRT